MTPKTGAKFTFAGAVAYLLVTGPTEWFPVITATVPAETKQLTIAAIAVVIGGLLSLIRDKTDDTTAGS